MNEVLNAIFNRRSIRAYTDKKIGDEDLNSILKAGLYAPSGKNIQPWHFTAVVNRGVLKDLKSAVRETYEEYYRFKDVESFKKRHLIISRRKDYDFTFGAPLLIILSAGEYEAMGMPDCAAAVQNMMLAAHSLGIGSCWVNQLHRLCDEPKVRDALTLAGVPQSNTVHTSAVFGYSANTPPHPVREEKFNIVR